jgi:hypothetical protein
MIIRTEQIRRMQDAQEQLYVEALARHLEREFGLELAAHRLAAAELRQILGEAIRDARGYHVDAAPDLMLYAECVAILGPYFDRSPERPGFGAILRLDDRSGDEKMNAISDLLLFGPGGPR